MHIYIYISLYMYIYMSLSLSLSLYMYIYIYIYIFSARVADVSLWVCKVYSQSPYQVSGLPSAESRC